MLSSEEKKTVLVVDFKINQIMRENNNNKISVQVLHPTENIDSFQFFFFFLVLGFVSESESEYAAALKTNT